MGNDVNSATRTSEDYVFEEYYPLYSTVGNALRIQGFNRVYPPGFSQNVHETSYELGKVAQSNRWQNAGRWLQVDYKDKGVFYFRWSNNGGTTWYPMNTADKGSSLGGTPATYMPIAPHLRPDMNGVPHQVGLFFSTFGTAVGYAEFDNFCLGRNLMAKSSAHIPQPGHQWT